MSRVPIIFRRYAVFTPDKPARWSGWKQITPVQAACLVRDFGDRQDASLWIVRFDNGPVPIRCDVEQPWALAADPTPAPGLFD